MQVVQILGAALVDARHVAFVYASVSAFLEPHVPLSKFLAQSVLQGDHPLSVLGSAVICFLVCLSRVFVASHDLFVGISAGLII